MLRVLIGGLVLGALALLYFMTTSVDNPPGPGTDSVPAQQEPPQTPPSQGGPY